MEYLVFFGKCIFGGIAALGFGILFNVAPRTLFNIFILGSVGIAIRTLCITLKVDIIISTFIAAVVIGFVCQLFAIKKKLPPLLIAIPSIIPMIPGIFLYEMMIGLINLSAELDSVEFTATLSQTVNNGLKAIFILLALSFGISLPYLAFRKDSFNYIKVSYEKEEEK